MKTKAMLLVEGSSSLKLGLYELPKLKNDEILVEPIYACWEANMSHALARKPLDLCKIRKEKEIILGNAGVVRILTENHPRFKAGQLCMLYSGDTRWEMDHGYALRAYGYDAPHSMGMLAEQTIVHQNQLFPIPENSKLSLLEWAAFSLRYITAWSNWKIASRSYRAMIDVDEHPSPYVCGWGGGVTLAALQLAQFENYQTAMIASGEERLSLLKKHNITPIDRQDFIHLDSEKNSAQHLESEKNFLKKINEITKGEMVSIFIDMIGGPVFPSTLKALARPGIITTAGWKMGMDLKVNRARECINLHGHIHTHYGSLQDTKDAMAFAEKHNWKPAINNIVWNFDNLSELIEKYKNNEAGYFPIIKINEP